MTHEPFSYRDDANVPESLLNGARIILRPIDTPAVSRE